MAGSLNRATILGNVGKDPAIKSMNSGDRVANFSMATSEKWTDKSTGEVREKSQWHNIVVWGKLADIVEKYVRKGSKVMVEGAIETRKYEKDGHDVYTTEIVLRGFDSRLILLGDPKGERSDSDTGSYSSARTASTPSLDPDDEIPF